MRIRTVKPGFFLNEELADLEHETGLPVRVAFVGLWCAADREGRFEWRPRRLKAAVLPYDEVDFGLVLSSLESRGLVMRYEAEGKTFGVIPTFKEHQVVNQREAASKIPRPPESMCTHVRAPREDNVRVPRGENVPGPLRQTVLARDGGRCVRCGSSEDLTIDHIFPQSIGGTHAATNLRTLCRRCNSARPVHGDGLIEDLKRDGLGMDDMQRTCMHVHARGEGKGREQEGKEETREGAPDLSPPERAGLPRDPMADHFRGKAPGQREDVRQLFDAWKLAVKLPEAKLRGSRDPDAVTLAELIDLHGLEDCLKVAHHAPQDGMVSGRLDDKGVKHPSIRYIFGNSDAFLRILHAAREAEGRGSGRLPAHEALARARAL
jgi:5-methylcytosine-specific restriction endonuclease McrA